MMIFVQYAKEMQQACDKAGSRVDFVGYDVLGESFLVRFNNVRSIFHSGGEFADYRVETRTFEIEFRSTEVNPRPQHILIRSPRGRFAHPNSDGLRICIGETLPKLLPADMLLLHVYRILTFQKFNILSAVNAGIVRFIVEQPRGVFPTDSTPLYGRTNRV